MRYLVVESYARPTAAVITALASDAKKGGLWVGTQAKGIFHFHQDRRQHYDRRSGLASNQITSLAVDAAGSLWAGTLDAGLMRYQEGRWEHFSSRGGKISYSSIGWIRADPRKGIWYVAHPTQRSRGLGYFDGQHASIYNPPYDVLRAPAGLFVDLNGHVWVGTAFDGLYALERK